MAYPSVQDIGIERKRRFDIAFQHSYQKNKPLHLNSVLLVTSCAILMEQKTIQDIVMNMPARSAWTAMFRANCSTSRINDLRTFIPGCRAGSFHWRPPARCILDPAPKSPSKIRLETTGSLCSDNTGYDLRLRYLFSPLTSSSATHSRTVYKSSPMKERLNTKAPDKSR